MLASFLMKSSELREKFLIYFEEQGHKRVRSASLIPFDDPTLYFTNAGMVPFKKVFTGEEGRDYTRATSSQKCMRVSGKHNDLENVGRTARHHTFFEMLGNFSFGDYFKKEAIHFSWDFLTKEVGLDQKNLWVTVHDSDDEAEKLWLSETSIAKDRVKRFGDKDNFWSMGAVGPCGPCSEIHYDQGPEMGTGPDDVLNGAGDRFMEIWNLVFMQYQQDESGKRTPLPKPSIDTGMGLERLAAVLQGAPTNYDCDLFSPIIEEASRLTHIPYGENADHDVSLRVLADHIRSTSFLIADGVQPSNEGRGYVLRRIMRRAIRHGQLLGLKEAFFYQLSGTLREVLGESFPELTKNKKIIDQVIQTEEERFLETLEHGLKLIGDAMKKYKADKSLPGDVVFTLYDTFGFPTDLTELIAEEKGYQVDHAGFETLMSAQKERGRKAWKGSSQAASGEAYEELARLGIKTDFVGYGQLNSESSVAALLSEGERIDKAQEGKVIELVTPLTPFYAESGGQVGDQGIIQSKNAQLMVLDTHKSGAVFLHKARVTEGSLQEGDEIHLAVDPAFRKGAMIHHSATHLFHAALRNVLGEHVRQGGSLVTPHRLRFDFSHCQSVSAAELQTIEDEVNREIRHNLQVICDVLPYDEAIKKGALAFFGDKYGDEVRVLSMGDYSIELCGGTHVSATGEIGLFKIVGQTAVGAGTRRVEAVVGPEGIQYLRGLEQQINSMASKLNTTPKDLNEKLEKYLLQVDQLKGEVEGLQSKLMSDKAGSSENIEDINGIKLMTLETEVADKKLVRKLSDDMIGKVRSGIVAIGAKDGNNVRLVIRVTKNLTDKYKAGDLVKKLAPIIGGKGGGRPDMAEAGGTDASQLTELFSKLKSCL
jgi:alanyl-tRNA synthetase